MEVIDCCGLRPGSEDHLCEGAIPTGAVLLGSLSCEGSVRVDRSIAVIHWVDQLAGRPPVDLRADLTVFGQQLIEILETRRPLPTGIVQTGDGTPIKPDPSHRALIPGCAIRRRVLLQVFRAGSRTDFHRRRLAPAVDWLGAYAGHRPGQPDHRVPPLDPLSRVGDFRANDDSVPGAPKQA